MATNVSEKEARDVVEAARESEWKLPSFGKQLFLGDFRLDLIHPQPRLDPEAIEKGEHFLAELQAVLAAEVDPLEIERDAKIPDRVVDALKGIGALGMKVPTEYGGLGLSQVYYAKALSLAGNYSSAICTLLSAHQSIGVAEPLRQFGSEEQRRKWLPLVAKDHISAFLLTEPGVGSDPARMASTATPVAPEHAASPIDDDMTATPVDGGYMINGRKLWATNGTVADIVVVMAKVPKGDGHRGGISAFVLPYTSEGVTVLHRNAFMGLRGIENSVTILKDVFVPEENRIAREGDGLKIALTTLNTGRLALMAIAVGASKWATKIAREWSAERVQWGRPIGKHDAVAQKLAFIAGSAFGLEAMLDVAARLADNKRNDIRIEAALCKLYGSELAWKVIDELMQVRGGRGYETAASLKARGERPVPVEQVMRDMRVNRIFEGSSEIMHLLIAREAVDTHLHAAGGLLMGDGDVKAKADAADEGRVVLRQVAAAAGRRQGPEPHAPMTSLDRWRAICATSSGRRANWHARRSTEWRGGRPSSSRSRRSWPASSTSAPSCSRFPRRSATPTRSGGRPRSVRPRRSSSQSCSARWPSAERRTCSASCSTTTTTPATRPRRTCWTAATAGSRKGSSTHRATAR